MFITKNTIVFMNNTNKNLVESVNYDIIECYYIHVNVFSFVTVLTIDYKLDNVFELEHLKYCEFITHLEINKNEIEFVNTSRWNFNFLKTLKLCSCKLKSFPQFILALENIEKLICINNEISTIPRAIVSLPKLKFLNLIDNNIIACLLPYFQLQIYHLGLQYVISDFVRNSKLIILIKQEDINKIYHKLPTTSPEY